MFKILSSQSFWPLWLSAVLGAANDNLVRAAIVIMAASVLPIDQAAIAALVATGLLALPFVLFSGWSGSAADRFDKTRLLRIAKISELGITGLALLFLASGAPIAWSLGLVFLMGVQSTFFGPIKQGWLPERLAKDDLVGANALLDAGTQLAIVGGTLLGGALYWIGGPVAAGIGAVALAGAGLLAGFAARPGTPAAPDLRLPKNPFAGNIGLVRMIVRNPVIARPALLQTWFWGAGAIALSVIPTLLRDRLDAGESTVTLVMALFASGIALGALGMGRALHRSRALWPVPAMAAGIAVSSLALWAGFAFLPAGGGLAALAAHPAGWAVIGATFALAGFGGAFIVPLHAYVQARAEAACRARVMAGLNVVTALAAAGASFAATGLIGLGLSAHGILAVLAGFSTLAALVTAAALPRETVQAFFRMVLMPLFRVEITGREHLATQGPVVFAANHVSLLDGPLVFSLIDREADLCVDTGWANRWYLKLMRNALRITAINPQQPISAKHVAKGIADGGAGLIFPEGRITVTGAPMKVYPGTSWLMDTARAQVVPIHIEGFERCRFAKPQNGWRKAWFPKVRVHVGAPRVLDVDPALRGKARREVASLRLVEAMEETRFRALDRHSTLVHAIAEAKAVHGAADPLFRDIEGNALTRGRLALGGAALGRILRAETTPGERVGVLLPAAPGAAAVLLAFWREGRVPALLNPTVGAGPSVAALGVAGARTVLTSRVFVERGKLQNLVAAYEAAGLRILWTEELRARVGTGARLRALIDARRIPAGIGPDTPAAVLFTSGTEGTPKGVVLTHGNLLANVSQLRARTDIGPRDSAVSALPLFHSFGLTAGLILPMLAGIRTGLHPSPLHYRVIPEFVYQMQATLLFGTDTFLTGWGRRAAPQDFASLRAAIAGAEPVRDATRKDWSERFGVRILEGYGATETGPVLALNTPGENQVGTVGRLLPGIEARLETVPGVEGLRLLVRGPNVMAGYLRDGVTGIEAPEAGWYDTGDVVAMTAGARIGIVGRAKRFAKVGGEMVSLAAVEALAARTWPGTALGAVALPDPRKGQKVVLAVAHPGADRATLISAAKEACIAEILLPQEVVAVAAVPLLASGKTDLPALQRMIERQATGLAA